MRTAISTACLYPAQTENALDTLLKAGFKTFEIFLNTESEVIPSYLLGLKEMLNNNGASLYSVHLFSAAYEPLMFFSEYLRRFDDAISQYSRYCASVAQVGAQVLVFHGDRRGAELPIEEYCERFYRLSQATKREGIILAQENVSRCRSALVESIKVMREYLGSGNIKFVLDIKQAVRANESPFDMCDAMGSDIINVHISDNDIQRDCMLPGMGTMDFKKLTCKLDEYGYFGPLIIEVYRANFKNFSEIEEAKYYIDSIFSDKFRNI